MSRSARPQPLSGQHQQQVLVLAGGGHTHVLLLRQWAMHPHGRPPCAAVVLVSRHGTAFYSGMVPGVVAGLYPPAAAAIDLRQLCARAGVVFLQAEITGLLPASGDLQLQGRPALRFDRLSLDLGAVTASAVGAEQPVKPLEPFLAWAAARPADEPLRIRGGGAAAVELALAFRARGAAVEVLLRGDGLRLGSEAANRRGTALLAAAGVRLQRRAPSEAAADLACTGSRAPHWLAASGLPLDAASGRVLTEPTLVVQGHPNLFACGDCGLIAADPRPASGVWAVRAAPVLAENLRRSHADPPRPLRRWRPQPFALQLLGDGGAVAGEPLALACYGPLAVGPSRWLWRWKDRLDRQFMGMLAPAAMASAEPMACRGCAAKLPASPLAAALARLQPDGQPPAPDDAAVVGRDAEGELLLQSVDGFPALVDDPWLNARLTTLHACSDLWASGAAVLTAQALVTLPASGARWQEELLLQTLAGVRSVLDPLGAALVGGHTLEGRDGAGLGLALTVNGRVRAEHHWSKGPLPAGALLLLSRPLGSGVLFAAAMAGAADPAWIDAALDTLQQQQAAVMGVLARHGCLACTDVTGFGLLGHLGEMLGPSGRVQLDGAAIPAFAGALELLQAGFASSLAPANASALALLDPGGPVTLAAAASAPQRQLWIDPQTCGPLLAALPAEAAATALKDLRAAGFPQAALIGRVLEAGSNGRASPAFSRAPASPR
ncbi:MAG: selenide, water dikinase SelD [Vulcanococcus sp.]